MRTYLTNVQTAALYLHLKKDYVGEEMCSIFELNNFNSLLMSQEILPVLIVDEPKQNEFITYVGNNVFLNKRIDISYLYTLLFVLFKENIIQEIFLKTINDSLNEESNILEAKKLKLEKDLLNK